jgi:hypothetical protein
MTALFPGPSAWVWTEYAAIFNKVEGRDDALFTEGTPFRMVKSSIQENYSTNVLNYHHVRVNREYEKWN